MKSPKKNSFVDAQMNLNPGVEFHIASDFKDFL